MPVRFGVKEIVIAAVSIPFVYKRIRKLKLKYDAKEKRVMEHRGRVFNGVLVDQYGRRWVQEDKV